MTTRPKFIAWLLFIFLGTFAWGTSFYWIKISLREISAFETAAWRFSFGTVFLWIICLMQKEPVSITTKFAKTSFIYALLMMIIPITLITWSEIYITSSVAGLLNSLTPLATVAISMLSLENRKDITISRIIGMCFGFIGVFLILMRHLSFDSFEHGIVPQFAVVLATISYAAGTIYGKRPVLLHYPLKTSVYAISWALLCLWVIVLLFTPSITLPKAPTTWLAVAWLGIVGGGLAFMTYLKLIKILGPSRTAGVAYLFPLTAYFLGVLLLDEPISLRECLGGVLIFTGIYISRR